jgi:hypothetical protein
VALLSQLQIQLKGGPVATTHAHAGEAHESRPPVSCFLSAVSILACGSLPLSSTQPQPVMRLEVQRQPSLATGAVAQQPTHVAPPVQPKMVRCNDIFG